MKEIEIQASCTKETSVTHEMLASIGGADRTGERP